VLRVLFMLVGVLAASAADAQELVLLGGATHNDDLSAPTYGWAVEYAQGLGEHPYVTLAWLNEGHFQDHHRDGPAAQLWGRANLLRRRLSLCFGVGPYSYFDTAQAEQGASYANDHGWGVIFSAGLTWYTDRRWLFNLRVNRIETQTNVDTTMVLLGAGYQLDAPAVPGPRRTAPRVAQQTPRNQVVLFLGQTILNSYESENSTAAAAEYRLGLGRYVDWTAGWLHEGGNHIIRREGVTTQFWLARPFFRDHLTLGVGAGAYFVVSQENDDSGDDERVSGILTLTGSYRFDPHWVARLSWDRVVTRYDRDTDVILFGGGYSF
jgi:hypothetical protein